MSYFIDKGDTAVPDGYCSTDGGIVQSCFRYIRISFQFGCLGILHLIKEARNMNFALKDLLLKKLKVVPLFIRLMTPNDAIWSLDQRTVIMR